MLVEGIEMNYAKVGSGKHAVLLVPGAFGTAEQMKSMENNKTNSDRVKSAWVCEIETAEQNTPAKLAGTQCVLDLSPNGKVELSTIFLDTMVYRRMLQHHPSSEILVGSSIFPTYAHLQ